MPELSPRDRLQPFLLAPLTDYQPHQPKESRDKQVYSPRQIKESLMRDLAWLLNTPAPSEEDGYLEFPLVATSVLNYGVPDLTGTTASSVSGSALDRGVQKAIQTYEPRLEKRGLTVRLMG